MVESPTATGSSCSSVKAEEREMREGEGMGEEAPKRKEKERESIRGGTYNLLDGSSLSTGAGQGFLVRFNIFLLKIRYTWIDP